MSKQDDPRLGVVEKFYGTHGEMFFVQVAPMGEIVVHIDQVTAALSPEEARKLGRRILRLSNPDGEGGEH